MEKRFYSVNEFAKILSLSRRTIIRAIEAGKINAFRPGLGAKANYRIAHTELERIAIVDFEEVVKRIRGE